jgi:hypothetical protein
MFEKIQNMALEAVRRDHKKGGTLNRNDTVINFNEGLSGSATQNLT